MENNKITYIKVDDNKIINEKMIRWVTKMGDCLEICTKSDGCREKLTTHRICRLYNEEGYNKLNKHFT